MDALGATLKRAFAEAHEPVDDAFVVAVAGRVAQRERMAVALSWLQVIGIAVGAMAAATGLFALVQPVFPQFLADAGLTFARTQGALATTEAPSFTLPVIGAATLTQGLMIVAALVGGAAVVRSNQQ